MTFPNVSMDLFQSALLGYERQKALLDERIAEIRRELAAGSGPSDVERKPRRGMSADGRARVAAAQRKRWAGLKNSEAPPAKTKAKRKMSAAGRKRIIAATRKRWAAWRAANLRRNKARSR